MLVISCHQKYLFSSWSAYAILVELLFSLAHNLLSSSNSSSSSSSPFPSSSSSSRSSSTPHDDSASDEIECSSSTSSSSSCPPDYSSDASSSSTPSMVSLSSSAPSSSSLNLFCPILPSPLPGPMDLPLRKNSDKITSTQRLYITFLAKRIACRAFLMSRGTPSFTFLHLNFFLCEGNWDPSAPLFWWLKVGGWGKGRYVA